MRLKHFSSINIFLLSLGASQNVAHCLNAVGRNGVSSTHFGLNRNSSQAAGGFEELKFVLDLALNPRICYSKQDFLMLIVDFSTQQLFKARLYAFALYALLCLMWFGKKGKFVLHSEQTQEDRPLKI